MHDFSHVVARRSPDLGVIVHHEYTDDLQTVAGGDKGRIVVLLEFEFAGLLDPEFRSAVRADTPFPGVGVVKYLSAVEAGDLAFACAAAYRLDNVGKGPPGLCRGKIGQSFACFDNLMLEFRSRFHDIRF